ncbi:MAG TPA: TIGR03016 family PEP-CTERM system-associated outer membrane protein [Rhodanobacteraceae bacterium]|nr:TIGR03016 family PEP-CTERM system-associated outer membrane protein [Rhodanobacteraceae bacterium]
MILAALATQAMAQDVDHQTTPTVTTGANGDTIGSGETSTDKTDLPPGVIWQPTLESPGLVTGFTLGELYTDNLRLASDNQSKENGWITVVKPFVKAAYSGRRFSGVLDAALTGYLYANHGNDNQLAQHLDAHGTLAMVQEHLFLDGAATYRRAIINHERPAGSGTFFLSNNRANVGTAMLSPYWVQGLGRVGTMTLRYTRGWVTYNRNGIPGVSDNPLAGVPDIRTYGLDFSIVSPMDQTWGWGLSYAGNRIKSDKGLSLHFAKAKAKLSRELGMHGRVLVEGGKENHYYPDGHVDTLGATFWAVGYTWNNPRNTFRLTGGHRFYGRSGEFYWRHEASRLTTHVEYMERPTDLNQQLMESYTGVGLYFTDIGVGIPSLLEHRVYLMKRASASADYLMPNGRLSLTLFNEVRDYFLRDTGHETISDAHLSWRVDLGPLTALTPTLGWRRYRFADSQINYTRYVQLSAVHEFSPVNSISLRLRHESRSTNAAAAYGLGYKANVIFLSWTHLFQGG